MPAVSVRAHFDGEHILLDEPLSLGLNAKLVVTLLPETDEEREGWLHLSAQTLEAAYGDEEPEYDIASVQKANPLYDAR